MDIRHGNRHATWTLTWKLSMEIALAILLLRLKTTSYFLLRIMFLLVFETLKLRKISHLSLWKGL